ncbi:Putative aminoacyl-tRNA synthetase, class I, rossmann-like alpha/beta/alpha sandwich [Septoria linicola]|uniref:Tryptophan--tRNA ligase, mitochondrial n=1 Tax=Septoria linicola TaxID=215465 RepID=A0A9Q9EHL9_9PEZI|nr:putative aminoacyl-tRNA synthetase, class I, rossmann-like alpha/beta/alpha sandwich [Septoria linicola]USW51120.1 Putative aminoacyl-tRNA synthetase, class I, rossmann-like alpha/beta/alpha sandwich [Septoria linicola]
MSSVLRSYRGVTKCQIGVHARFSVEKNVVRSFWSSSSSDETARKVIFSGIQPTGVPHLGNYLGALRQWVRLQDEAEDSTTLIYSLVDLHAITIRQDPAQLRQWKKESLAMLLAIGLDPDRSTIFHQSDISAHSELMWILSCQASTGYLSRMTQWKDKTSNEKDGNERLKLGLFSYPVLQAADVLVHRTTHVPVGHDQAQHLEFAREVALGFNHQYGDNILTPPETLISPAKRVMSLTEPASKMSKSHPNPKSRILLTDSEETIKQKLKSAVTDSLSGISYNPQVRPGVSNLVDLIYYASGYDTTSAGSQEDLAKEMEHLSLRAVKDRAADVVNDLIEPIRERYAEIIDSEDLEEIAEAGAEEARESANSTMDDVRRAVGFR